jgi:hypothetical protein
MRSRVTSNSWPISSSVCSRSQPMAETQTDHLLLLGRKRLQDVRGLMRARIRRLAMLTGYPSLADKAELIQKRSIRY